MNRVTVVVVSYETKDALVRCVDSVRRHADLEFELRIVDNASSDGSADAVQERKPKVKVIRNETNVGFARAANQGYRAGEAPYVLFLNSDAQLEPGTLPLLVSRMESDPTMGAIGPQIRRPGGLIELSFGSDLSLWKEAEQRRLVRGLRLGRADVVDEVERLCSKEWSPDWLSGACLLARRKALNAVDGFDERFFLYEEDADLGLRLRREGWWLLFTPATRVVHQAGMSARAAAASSRLAYERSHVLYYDKHRGRAETLLLRKYLASTAALSWFGSLGPGAERRSARDLAAKRFSQALKPVAPLPPADQRHPEGVQLRTRLKDPPAPLR